MHFQINFFFLKKMCVFICWLDNQIKHIKHAIPFVHTNQPQIGKCLGFYELLKRTHITKENYIIHVVT